MQGSPSRVRQILQSISDALSDTAIEARAYFKEHPDFHEVGEGVLAAWEKGREHSLASS